VYLFLSASVYKVRKESYTMKLEPKVLRLIAVGASITANCQPCLQTNVARALEAGAGEQEIAEAIEVGKRVRQGAASKMDMFVSSLPQSVPLSTGPSMEGCNCNS
jgi:AhpD family alkylhydroperoxidase